MLFRTYRGGPEPHACFPLLQAAAQQGQTAAPNAEEEVDLHFVAFVCRDGSLYELDGRKVRRMRPACGSLFGLGIVTDQ